MKIKWRKWNRAIHRDLGYFFAAMSIIYGISGIALNHLDDWNPSYHVIDKKYQIELPEQMKRITTEDARKMLEPVKLEDEYRKIYLEDKRTLKIFVKGGDVRVDLNTGQAHLQQIKRIPLIYQFNILHYNNFKGWWMWFSDLYAASLILLAVTGLFILRGKQGITGRGAWLTIAGILVPLILFFLYV